MQVRFEFVFDNSEEMTHFLRKFQGDCCSAPAPKAAEPATESQATEAAAEPVKKKRGRKSNAEKAAEAAKLEEADPFADNNETWEEVEDTPAISLTDLKKRLIMKSNSVGAEKIRDVIGKYTDGKGAKLDNVPESNYAALLEEAEALG